MIAKKDYQQRKKKIDTFACIYHWGDPEKPKQQIKEYQYTTIYPTNKILQQKFQSSDQISEFLLKNAMEIGYCKWQLFAKTIINEGDHLKIVYNCRHKMCNSVLIYHEKVTENPHHVCDGKHESKYYLARIRIDNFHSHPIKLTKKLLSEQNIRQYLFDLPVEQKFENHVEVVKQRFDLSKCQARYLKDRVFWRFKNEDHMLSKLTERRVLFRRKMTEDQEKSDILILISQSMKKNYEKYGDIVCFDITYKLLMRKKEERKHTGMGFFIGLDQNSRMIIYGMAVISQENSDHFYMLFEFFFDMMVYIPQTILTDDQRALGNALQRLKIAKKYNYVHLLDWYHKIESLKKLLKRQPCREELLRLYVRLMKEPSKQVYRDIIYEIAEMQERQHIIKDFLKEQKQCVLSQVPERFFGFGISSTRAEAFNSLIKRSVPIQTNLGRLVFFTLRVEKRLINRMGVLEHMHHELLYTIHDEEILELQHFLETLAFEQVRQNYHQSLELDKLEFGTSPVLDRKIAYRKYDRKYYFNLKYDTTYGCWRCQCKNHFRTGIPCPHIMRVVREYGGCVGYYVNERWIHDKDHVVVKKETRPDNKKKKIS